MPKVSVIIPSYNHERFIEDCIQSVLDQTSQDFEIIITDDGSSDETVKNIKKFNDSRIKLFCFEKNEGACAAIEKCIQETSGKYIAMLSSDDMFLPDKLERQVEFLDNHPDIAIVFGLPLLIDEDGKEFADYSHPACRVFMQITRSRYKMLNFFFYHGNCLCHPTALIRKECYTNLGTYDKRFASLPDFDFWVRVCLKYNIHIMQKNLIKFRIRNDDTNASGYNTSNLIRYNWEYKHILNHFLSIESFDEFLNIFPNAKSIACAESSELIPFYIAKLALNCNSDVHKLFGVDTLINLLNDKETAFLINTKVGFSYKDLIKITGSQNLFNQNAIIQGPNKLLVEQQLNLIKKFVTINLIRPTLVLKTRLMNKYFVR